MHRRLRPLLVGLFALTALFGGATALAYSAASVTLYLAKVTAAPGSAQSGGLATYRVTLLNGPDKGQSATGYSSGINSATDVAVPVFHRGDTAVVSLEPTVNGALQVALLDEYRLPMAGYFFALVILLAVIFAGRRGLGSLAGLVISLVVIGGYVVPQVLHGADPYVVTMEATVVIATLGMYCAHGFSRRTTLALASIYLTLILVTGLSALAVHLASLTGLASEDVAYLHQQFPSINLSGLLFGGIVLGMVGVLDDVAVGQATTVDELRKTNPKLSWQQLYLGGLAVGREHIASLVTTLVLAYVGSSMLFIVFAAGTLNLPIWAILNSELVMEEVIRSLAGSISLILAVPIATLLASYFLTHDRLWRGLAKRLSPRL
jgi:uncharacterized membrane protein